MNLNDLVFIPISSAPSSKEINGEEYYKVNLNLLFDGFNYIDHVGFNHYYLTIDQLAKLILKRYHQLRFNTPHNIVVGYQVLFSYYESHTTTFNLKDELINIATDWEFLNFELYFYHPLATETAYKNLTGFY